MSQTAHPSKPHVYSAIAAVMDEISKEGISKDRKNQQQGYSFRGIDDIFNTLSPVLSRNKLCILPTVLERKCDERHTKSGTPLFYTTVKVQYDFVSADDGSKHQVVTYGEAMDSADKSTNKAMSAAYKYACLQAFCIPTEGDNDADATTHELAPTKRMTSAQADELRRDASVAGLPEAKICSTYNARRLEDIPMAYFDEIKRRINTYADRASVKEAEAA